MVIGDLDLDWAEKDPKYLGRIKGFLVSKCSTLPAQIRHDDGASKFGIRCTSIVPGSQLGKETLPEKVNEFGGDAT